MLNRYFPGFLLLILLALAPFGSAIAADAKNTLPDRILGDAKAPVTIYDYSSMTCPHCADFHVKILPEIKKQWIDTGKAKWIFRDFPLDKVALQASVLTRCADEARFYPLLDVLFQNQAKWAFAQSPHEALASYGVLAGVSKDKYDACLKDKKMEEGILAVQLEAQQKHKIESTPSFVLTGPSGKTKMLAGEVSAEIFGKEIQNLTK